MDRFTFTGQHWRVQVVVFDWSDSLPQWRNKPTTFCVRVLPASANRYCAFSLGSQPYYGESVEDAWKTVTNYVRNPAFPDGLREYLKGEVP